MGDASGVTSSARKDPRKLTTLPDILSTLSSLQSEEAELSNSLGQLLSDREPVNASLSRLDALVSRIDHLYVDANMLQGRVSGTALTAERIGGKVRSLDEEMRRIREAADQVAQVIDLKSSITSMQSSMDEQDWEGAARHCARAMALPTQVIEGRFAETTIPTAENHLPPAQTLQMAREQLLTVFQRKFEAACRSRDSAATTRFFKLFPAIGWEKEGLEAYAAFVVDLVRVRAPASAKTSSPLYYITSLTALFESIAMIVDQHQPVVEKYYGRGKMKSVVGKLLEECDRVVKGVLDSWEEERLIKRKLTDIHSHPPVPMFSPLARTQPLSAVDEEAPDARQIDKLVTEISGMTGRWSLFKKFILEAGFEREDEEPAPDKKEDDRVDFTTTSSEKAFEDVLQGFYSPLEAWYCRTVLDKAHRHSNTDLSQSTVTTTTPDDAFYILKVIFTRLLSTGSLVNVQRMTGQLREIVEQDLINVYKKKMDEVYRGPASQPGQKERENRNTFIAILNDLDVSSSHLERLSKDLAGNSNISQHFLESEQVKVKEAMLSLSALTPRFRSLTRIGVEQLFTQLMRPKLRSFITDMYKDVTYSLDEDGYTAAEYHDLVRKRFVKAWENLMEGYKDTLTDENFRTLLSLTLDVILRPWEKFMMSMKFTELGAVRFDRDLRAITTYLAAQTAFGDVRSKFVRLQQMSTILNLDSEESLDEFYNSSGISWRLTAQEARSIASLAV